MYGRLAPGSWFKSVAAAEFCNLYLAQLESLDAEQVLHDLSDLANGRIPVLTCFEAPPPDPAWCHRALVAGWFSTKLGVEIHELGHEQLGAGWSHPKLPSGWCLKGTP